MKTDEGANVAANRIFLPAIYTVNPVAVDTAIEKDDFVVVELGENFEGLTTLMRQAGRSDEEITRSLETARSLKGAQAKGQSYWGLSCQSGRTADAFGIASQGSTYTWFPLSNGSSLGKGSVCPYTNGCGWWHTSGSPGSSYIIGHYLAFTVWGGHTSAYCN